jgi:hypothetical protein
MHSGGIGCDLQQARQLLSRRIDKRVLPGLVKTPHPSQVRGEVPLRDERRKGRLRHDPRMVVQRPPRPCKRLHQIVRHDEVADPQTREQHLREGAQIDRPAAVIEAPQGRQRRSGIAVLAVVIVLDDPGVRRPCPVEQSQAARQAHHRAHRVLMRWRNDRQPRVGGCRPAGGDVEPVVVQRHRHHSRAGGRQCAAQPAIARLLHPRRFAGVQEQPCDDVQRLLRPAGDKHLPPVAIQPARPAQVVRDGLAQRTVSARVSVACQRACLPAPRPGQQAAPQFEGKQRGIGHTGLESRWPFAAHREKRGQCSAPVRQDPPARIFAVRRRSLFRQKAVRQHPADIGAGAGASIQIAFREKLVERAQHRIAGTAKLASQRAARRQAGAGRQPPGQHGLAKLAIKLAVQRRGAGGVEGKRNQRTAVGAAGHHVLLKSVPIERHKRPSRHNRFAGILGETEPREKQP